MEPQSLQNVGYQLHFHMADHDLIAFLILLNFLISFLAFYKQTSAMIQGMFKSYTHTGGECGVKITCERGGAHSVVPRNGVA